MLGFARGSCRGQAAAEALAVFVALRLWFPRWRGQRVAVSIRSDSKAALGALGKFGSAAAGIEKVAREVALDMALSYYGVTVWMHLPAADNKVAANYASPFSTASPATLFHRRSQTILVGSLF